MASDTNVDAAAHHQFDARDALAKLGVEVGRLSEQHQEITTSLLESLYPDRVIVKESDQDTWRKQLWSLHQQAAKPILIFQPTCAKEVAVAVVICREAKVNFAVKSGGHAAMKNASSADGGVVIDLRYLDEIELNDEKTIAGIGPGNTWAKVFDKLSQHGLAVAGGRAGDVGVGGYTLGGGISFFASTRGWACDNIRNYELVTASGQILNVNYKSHPDLFWALRGGGSNYGICTRFDYETFPQGDIYAGSLIIDYEHKDAVTEAFAGFALNSDPRSAAWLTVVYYSGKKMFSSIVMHAEPTADFDMLKAYSKIPVIHQTHQVRSISDMTQQIAKTNVQGHHQNYQNTTFKFEPDFVRWLCGMYMHEIEPVQDSYESKQPVVMVLQYYTKESISYMHREGGNCLPLKEDEAPYLNLLTPSAWLHEKDNDLVMGIISKIHESAKEEGRKRGLLVDYVYMNYGSYTQDVLQGYGKENYKRLKQIAERYDPDAIFQNLMPGYFKFGGSPAELKDSKKVD